MSKQKFTHTCAFGGRSRSASVGGPVTGRNVTFEIEIEIEIDLDALVLDRGQAAINATTRKTTLCGGAIVVCAVKIEEAAR